MASLKLYLRLGGKFVFAGLFAAIVLYLLFVLRPWKKRALSKEYRARWMLSLWYLCTLLFVTFAGRWASRLAPFTALSLRPFDALREALVSTDRHAQNQMLLNVLLFVPLGLLLVWHAQRREKGAKLYWLVLLLPLGIELIQFATGLGLLDPDDLLLNSLGGAWGLCLGLCCVNLKKHKSVLLPALGVLLPVAVIAAGLLWLSARPYGFVPQDFTDPTHGKPQSVSVDALDGQLPESVTVYRIVSLSEKEAEQTADRLFTALGLTRNMNLSDVYDDLAVYWAEHSNVYVWVYFNGDFDLHIPNGLPVEGTPAEAALELLKQAGFSLPAPDEAEEDRMRWSFQPADGLLYDGEIHVVTKTYSGTVIEASLRRLQPGTSCAAYDAAALREALLEGRFSVYGGPQRREMTDLVCESLTITWIIDGKGCYHPVYQIEARIDGEPTTILAPAVS